MGRGGLTGGPSNFLDIQANLYHPGIGRMFPEKIVKICSVVAKLLLLICLKTKSPPQQLKKSLSRLTRSYFVKITTDHFLSPSKCDKMQQKF